MLMGSGVLQQGFTARAICLYSAESRHRKSRYEFTPEQEVEFLKVRTHIEALTKVSGEIKFTKEAEDYFDWYYEGDKDKTTGKSIGKSPMQIGRKNFDKRTDHYFARKKAHIQKLSMVLHFADSLEVSYIELETLKKAIHILECQVEPQMHHALASNSRNELYDLTKDVYEAIASSPVGLSSIQLKIMFVQDLDMEKEFPNIIKYLGEIGKIEHRMINSKMMYCATEKK